MKVSIEMPFSDKKVYDFLIMSLENEVAVYNNGLKKVEVGKKYERPMMTRFKHQIKTHLYIKSLVEPSLYEVQVFNGDITNEISISIVSIDDNKCLINYVESVITDNTKAETSYKIFGFFATIFNKRKIKKRFKQIEMYLNQGV